MPALAVDYVDANPRPAADSSAGIAAAQRMAILRRLAAGPARRVELLAAMRTVGWVGANDFENRMRDLRADDSRAASAAAGVAVARDADRYWLEEPFPLLGEHDRRALGFAKAMTQRLDGPLARQAGHALDGLLPGLAAGSGARTRVRNRASLEAFERFDAAMAGRRPVRVDYFSLNSGYERSYNLVPREYVTLGATVKALCVEVTALGRRNGDDRQFALDRLLNVEELPDWPQPKPAEVRLRRSAIVLRVTDGLYQVMRERDLLAISEETAKQSPYEDQTWRVDGSFPDALAWDVMEQLCAWSGSVQVEQPLWLVNAVMRRLRAGLRVMEEGGPFELVKPEPDRHFPDQRAAIVAEDPLPPPKGPRKLAPPD